MKNMPVYPVIGMDQCGDDQDLGRDVI